MNRNILYIFIVGGLLLMIFFLFINNKKEKVSYNLPLNPDPKVFGPHYWTALHSIVNRIPCPECKGFAEDFMVFFHDVVNKKIKKPTYDQVNYDKMRVYINSQNL